MDLLILFVEYFLLAGVVIYTTTRASYYIDELDKKSNISGALIGGVLLATITSMPEFITSLTSTIVLNDPGLAFGNVFGSNLFNILILAVADLIFVKHLFFNKVKGGIKTNSLIIIMYMAFILPLVLANFGSLDYNSFGITLGISFNLVSLMIIVIYVLSIKSMSEEDATQEDGVSHLTYKKIIIMFAVLGAVIIFSSYFITLVTNDISNYLNLESSFAGAIFLGIATSLPELTATITLFRLKNYHAALGGIIGSNVFNLTIISVVDLINYKDNIYSVLVTDSALRENIYLLLILGLFSSIILLLALFRKHTKTRLYYILPSVLIIIAYLLYISLSLSL